MKSMNRLALILATVLLAAWTVQATAQPVIDGTLDPNDYGAALSVQTRQTNFGDNFSELNAAYASIDGGVLSMMFTGNLQDNFNKVMVFFDTVSGGQNTIDKANNPSNFDSNIGDGFENGWDPYVNRDLADSGPPCCGAQQGSFTFDTGFEADYVMLFRRGLGKFDFDFSVLGDPNAQADEIAEAFGTPADPNDDFSEGSSGDLSAHAGNNSGTAYQLGFNNSNTAGVVGGTSPADPNNALSATTGIEFSIPLSALGNPTGDFKVSAFINGANHDFLSNQFLGGLDPNGIRDNLGSDGNSAFLTADRNLNGEFDPNDDYDGDLGDGPGGTGADALGVGLVDLNNFAGDQFFVVPNAATDNADFDGDGVVSGLDFLIWQQNVGLTGQTNNSNGDANGDGVVNGADLDIFETQYNTSPVTAAVGAVPEPTTVALLLMGAGFTGLRRRRS